MTSLDIGNGVRTALTRLREAWAWYDAIPPIRRIHAELGKIREGWRRITRWLNSVMPKGLYARALLIIIMPMVILQSVLAFVFVERQWNVATQRLSASVVHDVAALIDVYNGYPQDSPARADPAASPRIGSAWWSISCRSAICRRRDRNRSSRSWTRGAVGGIAQADRPPVLDRHRRQVGAGRDPRAARSTAVMGVFARRSAAYASNAQMFLIWMFGTSGVLLIVAVLFLRNQIKPILRLADAAESFGMGREAPNSARAARARCVAPRRPSSR